MKTRIVFAIATTLVVALGVAIAQQRGGPEAVRGGQDMMMRGGPHGGHGGHHHPPGPPPPNPVLVVLDADRDRTLSADEIAGATEALLTLDANGDGELTPNELRPPPPPPPGEGDIVERLMRHDRNADGLLAPIELLPPHAAHLFIEADTDGDGLLSIEELETWFQEHQNE